MGRSIRKRFRVEQIVGVLKQAEVGVSVASSETNRLRTHPAHGSPGISACMWLRSAAYTSRGRSNRNAMGVCQAFR